MTNEEWEAIQAVQDSEALSFSGPCTCDHDPSDHGWEHCLVPQCPCEAHWEE